MNLLADPEILAKSSRLKPTATVMSSLSPPPAANHGSYQFEIGHLLRTLMKAGRVLTECPISTADGVRAADVAWASSACIKELGNRTCFLRSPEICVEVLSPGNTDAEIQEKMALYFDAGAQEVWLCETSGAMKFFAHAKSVRASKLCPDFPARVELR